jgi:hypothetical protein
MISSQRCVATERQVKKWWLVMLGARRVGRDPAKFETNQGRVSNMPSWRPKRAQRHQRVVKSQQPHPDPFRCKMFIYIGLDSAITHTIGQN